MNMGIMIGKLWYRDIQYNMELFRLLRKVVQFYSYNQFIVIENEWNEFEQIFGEKSVF